jgi:hypothetical protein
VRLAVGEAGEGVAEAHRLAAALGHQQEAAGVDGGDGLDRGGDVEVGQPPDLPLQGHARVVVRAGAGLANGHRAVHRAGV